MGVEESTERPAFGKGLPDTDEPELGRKDLTGVIAQWIEVGEPGEKTILRACDGPSFRTT